jgi:uncharacterized 2Fe-2S/4Fe-4S cluster protein (DUF4445 family)
VSTPRFPVTLEPAGVTVWAEEGSFVLDAARAAGVMIPAPCGGRGVCGKCAIKVTQGAPDPPDAEELTGLKLAPKGVRLACRMRVNGPLTIRPVVPATTSVSAGEIAADEPLVAGVDLGTTSVSAVVVGGQSGRQLGRGTVANKQATYGADVLARVAAALEGHDSRIQDAALESIADSMCAACGSACSCLTDVARIVVVGNSVMSSALLGEPLEGFSGHPFTAPFDSVGSLPEGWQGERSLSEKLSTLVLPPIASFVGGDTTAALLAAGLIDADEISILVDIGTNAEVAVAAHGGLTVTSAAAGPALEAAGIKSGGPYGTGAVTEVRSTEAGELQLDVVGGAEPLWLAGSGLMSTIAVLRRLGHIDASGAMHDGGPLEQRFFMDGDIKAVLLHDGDESSLALTQTDVRAFQQAKAGVATAVFMSARAARIKPRKVARLVVTGALGGAIARDDLVELGVLPEDLTGVTETLEAAALTGAGMIATDPDLLQSTLDYTSRATHLDLAGDDSFSDTFMAALALQPFTIKKGF